MKTAKILPALAVALVSYSAMAAKPRVPLKPITSKAALDYAATALGKKYTWGGSVWDSTQATRGKGKGPDCSGLVLKSWAFPRATATTESLPGAPAKWDIGGVLVQPRQDTLTMKAGEYQGVILPWTLSTAFATAAAGDGIVWRGKKGGHTMLVWSHNKKTGVITTIEAIGSGINKTTHLQRPYSFLRAKASKLMKRDRMNGTGAPTSSTPSDAAKPEPKKPEPKKPEAKKPEVKPEPKPAPTPVLVKPAPDAPVTGGEETAYYTVKAGDDFYGIAEKYDITASHLLKLNPDVDGYNFGVGTKLRVQ